MSIISNTWFDITYTGNKDIVVNSKKMRTQITRKLINIDFGTNNVLYGFYRSTKRNCLK